MWMSLWASSTLPDAAGNCDTVFSSLEMHGSSVRYKFSNKWRFSSASSALFHLESNISLIGYWWLNLELFNKDSKNVWPEELAISIKIPVLCGRDMSNLKTTDSKLAETLTYKSLKLSTHQESQLLVFILQINIRIQAAMDCDAQLAATRPPFFSWQFWPVK